MGKYKGKKPKLRNNPLGIAGMKEILLQAEETDLADAAQDSGFIPTLLEQVRSHCAEERDSGLNSLSVGCQNEQSLATLLENGIVKTVGPLLLDKSAMVRHSAAGALRNMSAVGPAVCDVMIEQDIMTPLTALLKQKYSGEWSPGKKSTEKIDTVTETFVEAMHLLWNLCEASETALKVFNQEDLVEILTRPLNTELFPLNVVLAVAQLLNAVTEDNPEIYEKLGPVRPILEEYLMDSEKSGSGWSYLRILAIGILLNTKPRGDQLNFDKLTYYTKFLASALSEKIDTQSILAAADDCKNPDELSAPKESESGQSLANSEMEIDFGGGAIVGSKEDEGSCLISSQILALTILSNLIVLDDDEDDSELQSEDSGSESYDGGPEDDMEYEDSCDSAVSPEVLQTIVSEDVPGKIINIIQSYDSSAERVRLPEPKARLVRLIRQLHCTALLCYQNMVSTLDLAQLGGVESTEKLLVYLAGVLEELLKGSAKQNQLTLLEAATSLLRAILHKWGDAKVIKPAEWFNLATLQIFDEVYKRVSDIKIRTNVVKIIGWYGILLTRTEASVQSPEAVMIALRQIGDFLLHCACDPFEKEYLPVSAESLDTIFDVFAEDDYNKVLSELECVGKLKRFLPQFKKYVHSQRRDLGEHKAIIQTSKENLARFIVYKSKMGCS